MKSKYFSQGQDRELIINKYLKKNPEKEMGIYVDIGGGDAIENSNTYYYYLLGWIGRQK